jgi:hypothetical protein
MNGRNILSAHGDLATITTRLVKAASHALRYGLDKACGNSSLQL